jgi:hypothetical protein
MMKQHIFILLHFENIIFTKYHYFQTQQNNYHILKK